jgi:hypothetical protein
MVMTMTMMMTMMMIMTVMGGGGDDDDDDDDDDDNDDDDNDDDTNPSSLRAPQRGARPSRLWQPGVPLHVCPLPGQVRLRQPLSCPRLRRYTQPLRERA